MSQVEIQLLSLFKKKSYHIKIDNDYMYIDLIRYLCTTDPILESCSLYKSGKRIDASMLKDKVIQDVKDNILVMKEIGIFTPKNSFVQLKHLIMLFDSQLDNTVNILDVCPINQGPIGAWIGYGSGPIKVPKEEDNHYIWVYMLL